MTGADLRFWLGYAERMARCDRGGDDRGYQPDA